MNNILRMSEAASLAMHTVTILAANPTEVMSTREIASSLRVSEAHLSKVLQRLGKAGLVKSIRGPKGGFVLGQDPDLIRLLDVYELIDGPLGSSTCLLGSPACSDPKCCILGDLLGTIHEQVREYLAGAKLSELTDAFTSKDVGT